LHHADGDTHGIAFETLFNRSQMARLPKRSVGIFVPRLG
jgi:hypothetical protein